MTALEVIEWLIAAVVAVTHAIATNSRDPAVQQLGEGTEAAA